MSAAARGAKAEGVIRCSLTIKRWVRPEPVIGPRLARTRWVYNLRPTLTEMTLSLKFSVQHQPGQTPVFSRHRRDWHHLAYLRRRAVTLRSWRRVHRRFRWPRCPSRAVVMEPARRFRMRLAGDSSVPLRFLPSVDQSPRSHPVPQFDVLSAVSARLNGTSVFAVETLPRMLNCAVMVAAAYQCAAEALGRSPAMLSMAV